MQHMPAHVVVLSLGPSKASPLPMFHALTGSDTVLFFRNRGKKSAWDVWKVFPELTLSRLLGFAHDPPISDFAWFFAVI